MSLVDEYLRYLRYKIKKMRERKTARGIVNDLVDLIFHPLFGKINGAEALDILAHALIDKEIRVDKIIKETILPSVRRRWKKRRRTSS